MKNKKYMWNNRRLSARAKWGRKRKRSLSI